MAVACHNSVSYSLKVSVLKGWLDESSKAHLMWFRETNKSWGYEECWAELSNVHGYDVGFQNRKVWKNLKLDRKERKLRKAELIGFRGRYLLARSRVKGWSVEEDFELVYNQLDETWRVELNKEAERR